MYFRGCAEPQPGPTGCGKTSLLLALLSELHHIPMGSKAWLSLPRAAGIAYAAQESWVLNDTIRNNIVFTSEWDEERYKKGGSDILENDVQLMLTGTSYKYCISADWRRTLACSKPGIRRKLARRVSPSGSSRIARPQSKVSGMLTVYYSGGQKARVTLARAIYSSAQTVLLDDVSDMPRVYSHICLTRWLHQVLAALDVHTARWIVEKCLQGDLLKGRTVILVVSYQLHLTFVHIIAYAA
jgi:ABC-type uncharacterized transport system fused permease/ATPase subunit